MLIDFLAAVSFAVAVLALVYLAIATTVDPSWIFPGCS